MKKIDKNIKEEKSNLFAQRVSMVKIVQKIRKIYRNKELALYSRFEKKSDVMNGKLVIKNTRIPPEAIFEYLDHVSKKEKDIKAVTSCVIKNYPSINETDVIASVAYVLSKQSYLKILLGIDVINNENFNR